MVRMKVGTSLNKFCGIIQDQSLCRTVLLCVIKSVNTIEISKLHETYFIHSFNTFILFKL